MFIIKVLMVSIDVSSVNFIYVFLRDKFSSFKKYEIYLNSVSVGSVFRIYFTMMIKYYKDIMVGLKNK